MGRVGNILRDLSDAPWRFEFFQAVRLIERACVAHLAREADSSGNRLRLSPIGHDERPDGEAVRFRTSPSLSFAAADVVQLRRPQPSDGASTADGAGSWQQMEMVISFMGLTGQAGVLPRHYTTSLIHQAREKDETTAKFFDLFNHRLVSLFYRAWEKYRLPAAFERSKLDDGDAEDDFTAALFAFAGFSTPHLRNRLAYEDPANAYFSGHFACQRRPAICLELILTEYFSFDAAVLQFRGQWLQISEPDRSVLPNRRGDGRNNRLGVEVVLGEHVWDVAGRFRVRLGPLRYAQYLRLLPNGSDHHPVLDLIKTYAGLELDFDVQPVLAAAEVPRLYLDSRADAPAWLGWNSWLTTTPFVRDFEEVVFEPEGE